MYRYKQKKGKKKERSVKTSLNSLALHNARTFKSLSLRVRCIFSAFFVLFDDQQGILICQIQKPDIGLSTVHQDGITVEIGDLQSTAITSRPLDIDARAV